MSCDWIDYSLKFLHLFLVEFVEKVSWPLIVFLICGTFKEQIKNFLERMFKIGPSGAEAIPPSQITDKNITAATETISADSSTRTGAPAPSKIVEEVENNIYASLKNIPDYKNKNADERERYLIREYSVLAIRNVCLFVASRIFGTQIAVLRRLESSSPQSEQALMPIFKQHRKKFLSLDNISAEAKTNVTFYAWIAFLLQQKMIKTESNGEYSITTLGSHFISDFAPTENISEATRLF